MKLKVQRFPVYSHSPPAHPYSVPPLPSALTRVVHFLKLMNLHSHIITTPSPYFISGLIPGVVYSMGLDRCLLTYPLPQYHTEYFRCPKIPLCSVSLSPCLSSPQSNPTSEVPQPFPTHIQADTFTHNQWDHIVYDVLYIAFYSQ